MVELRLILCMTNASGHLILGAMKKLYLVVLLRHFEQFLNWIRRSLSGQNFRIYVDESLSQSNGTNNSVLQGSILVPRYL